MINNDSSTTNENKTRYDLVSTEEPNEKVDEDDENEDDVVVADFIETLSVLGASRTSLKKRSLSRQGSKPTKDSPNEISVEKEENMSKLKKVFMMYRGSLLALLSAFNLSVMVIIIKKTYLLAASEAALLRFTIAGTIMLTLAKYKNIDVFGPKKFRKTLLLRGFIGIIGMTSSLFALTFIKVKITLIKH